MIAEGSSKLASVPSGGAAAPAAGGAAAAAGGAAEEKKEEKVEGKDTFNRLRRRIQLLTVGYREGGVRRGYGLRSLRLSVSYHCPVTWHGIFRKTLTDRTRGSNVTCITFASTAAAELEFLGLLGHVFHKGVKRHIGGTIQVARFSSDLFVPS